MARARKKSVNLKPADCSNGYKVKLFIVLFAGLLLLFIPSAMAHCPLCTGITIAGVGATRALGLDDSLVGVFAGGMVFSSALWVNNILEKRGFRKSRLRALSLIIAIFIATLITYYTAGLAGPGNNFRIFGVERLTFGTLSGTIFSFAAFALSTKLKERNEGRTLFSYQTILLSIAALILNAFLFWAVF
ncbi:hypothetical protein J4447_04865 [Candidatus Pacearchaeota archaeon]|nr:hypothetical protein [Candidatus Pacearchaeota archaeon]